MITPTDYFLFMLIEDEKMLLILNKYKLNQCGIVDR